MTTRGKHSRDGVRDRFFLTRDSSSDGTLSDVIDVWLTRPIRHRITADGGAVWVSDDLRTHRTMNRGGRAHWCAVSLTECRERFGTVPSSDTVCLLLDEVGS